MFKKVQILFAVLLSICLSGCTGKAAETSNEPQELQTVAERKERDIQKINSVTAKSDDVRIPEIQVSFGSPSKVIPSMAGGYTLVKSIEPTYGSGETEPQKQTMIACGSDPILSLMNDSKEIPYVRLGSGMEVEFRNGTTPDSVVIEDVILNEDGGEKYGTETALTMTPDISPDGVEVSLEANPYVLLSSDAGTYQTGGVLRGFRMTCTWENGSEAEYAWVLRTDAVYGADGKTAGAYLYAACGTGVQVFGNVKKIDEDMNGMVVVFGLDNQMDTEYTYGDDFYLSRVEGKKTVEVPCKDGTGWNDIEHVLESKKSAESELPVGLMYGELEPGFYTIKKTLTNRETGDSFTVSSGFQVAE